MKTQFKLALCVSAIVLIQACTQDIVAPEETTVQTTEIKTWNPKEGIRKFIPPAYLSNMRAEDLEFVENELKGIKPMESRGNDIFIPAGSSNALAAAIASAQSGDVIVLGRGDHTQDGSIIVNKCVHIQGYGANLIFKNTPASLDYSSVPPGFHFKSGSSTSMLRGLTFKSTDSLPGVCVFIDNAEQIRIYYNNFENWQYSVIAYNAHYAMIYKNDIKCHAGWAIGALPESDGIIISGGHHVSIIDNKISRGLFGIFTGGSQGTDFGNKTSECLWGQILCKASGYAVGGTAVNTDVSTNNWLVMFNSSSNNLASGYLVIDGAKKNFLDHNMTKDNAVYDIELAGDSNRFGFLTPKSENNSVSAYYFQKVKDCGEQNQVYGGTKVNTTLDPCY